MFTIIAAIIASALLGYILLRLLLLDPLTRRRHERALAADRLAAAANLVVISSLAPRASKRLHRAGGVR